MEVDYKNYAEMLHDRFEIWLSVYKDARFAAVLDAAAKYNQNQAIRDAGVRNG